MKYPLAAWHSSPNFSKRHERIQLICCHQTDGQTDVLRAVKSHCQRENKKSAHFFVGQQGEVFQLVDTDDCAWHDSGRNQISIGVEHVARQPGEFNSKWATLSGQTKEALGASANDTTDPGLPLTAEQLRASAKLVGWLLRELGLPVEAVVPHCSSPKTTHKDCGRDQADGGIWPWEEYVGMVAEALLALS